jgi:hypothetical protein
MIEASKPDLFRPAGSAEEDNAPVNVDAILQAILGRGGERFGMAAAVLRGEEGGFSYRRVFSPVALGLDLLVAIACSAAIAVARALMHTGDSHEDTA